ncbi:MAG: (d)CMP kinase [Candidatus Eutrophobiaceae bacterium]
MIDQIPAIAIDGSSGVGKGELSRRLAQRLDWHLLDSGSLYRVLAHAAQLRGLRTDSASAVAELAENLKVRFSKTGRSILLDGEEVENQLRTECCGALASELAALPAVRKSLFTRQRDFLRPPGLVADGRDMGTTLFPEAFLKIFLTATPKERVRRRHKQLIEKGFNASLRTLAKDMARRDARDLRRKTSPLRPAEDAWIIDTTGLDIETVFELIWVRTEMALQTL